MALSSSSGLVVLSGLVEEAAALEEPRPLLGRDLDVSRREQEHLVGDALHPAVERIRQAAGEVDQALGQILVGALQIQNDRDRLLELVRDLLRVVEAARDDQVDAHRGRSGYGRDPGPQHRGAIGARLRVGPVVELAIAAAWGQPPDVRPLRVAALEVLVGDVAVLVPVLLLGDAEVDEGLVPHVRKAHFARNVTRHTGPRPLARGSLLPVPPPSNPGWSPWRARVVRAVGRGRAGGGSTDGMPPGRPFRA